MSGLQAAGAASVHGVSTSGTVCTQALQVLDAKVDTVMSGLANLKLAALPPVDAVMRTATPTAEAIVERYQQAHDALVAAPIYLRCAEHGSGLVFRRVKAPVHADVSGGHLP